MQSSAYASIQNQIILPHLHSISIDNRIFKPISNNLGDDTMKLSQPLLSSTNSLVDQLNRTFKIFQDPEGFHFKFPESMFPQVTSGQKNNIRYQQKIITEQENTFKDRLSDEQIKQIEEKGQFKVKSNIQYITLPYVWKINETLFWGQTKIQLVWKKSLSTIYGFFWSAKRLIQYQIPTQLNTLSQIPKQIFSLFFGSKSIRTVVSVNYDVQIKKDFWNKIMGSYYKQSPEWCSALWNYLYVEYDPELSRPIQYTKDKAENARKQLQRNLIREKYDREYKLTNQKINSISAIHDNFNQEWNKLRKRLIIQVTEQVNGINNSSDGKAESQEDLFVREQQQKNSDERILQKLSEKKFTLYVQHLTAELPKKDVPLQVINTIVFLLRLFNVIGIKQKKRDNENSKKRELVEKKIRQQHEIKSFFSPYFNTKVNEQMKIINKALEQEMYNDLLNDRYFTSSLKDDQIRAVKQFIKLKNSYDTLIEAKKKQKQQYHGPTRVFYSNYSLLPPYKVLRNQNYYSLKKISDNLTVDTSTNFWKLRLYWMRLKTWTINCLVTLVFSAWKGSTGFRCLWGIDDFTYDTNINYQTGQLIHETRRTVIGTFLKVIDGITLSRRRFEQTPDLGLLGKNVSRFFNYIQCYIFRFIFVGIIVSLICYPILIVVLSTLMIIFVVTFWAWLPVIMFITYLFNILIKQFQTAEDQYGFFSRTFPLIRIILTVLKCIGIMLLSILNLIIWAPIKTFFVFLFSAIQNLFRRLLDGIMLCIFRNLGRTPSRDTAICRKISGPGMSKQFYMSINEDDVYVLIQSNLEQIYVIEFNRLISNKINQNGQVFTDTVSRVISPFSGSYYSGQSIVIKNKNKLLYNYQQQYAYYMKRYPNNPYNVRFTQQEIDNYFQNTVSIVKKFVEKKQISKWIFEKYELYEGMYDELTRSVWMAIFGCGQQIFEPLQKLDSRFKLQDQYVNQEGFNKSMKSSVGKVMRALQGEVQLHHNNKRLVPWKHNLLTREFQNDQVREVFEFWRNNSNQNVTLNLNNVRTVFVPNLNIKSIIIVQDENRQRQIAAQEIIIDL